MMSKVFDVIVVGCGGMGSAVLCHLARAGTKVLGLEQFPCVHEHGSSHGQTRIIRQAYFEHPSYVPLLREAYELWDELAERVARPLLTRTGLLEIGPPGEELIQGLRASLNSYDLEAEELSAEEVRQRFPQFGLAEGDVGFFERNGGFLLVEECVRSHLEEAQRHGAEVRAETGVRELRRRGDQVQIVTDAETFTAKQTVLTAGAWTGQLLPTLAASLRVVRKHVHWLQASNPRYDLAAASPIAYFETAQGHFYTLPAIDERGVKVSEHTGGVPLVDPRESGGESDPRRESLLTFIRERLPAAQFKPRQQQSCLYTHSPDGHFMIDQHPESPEVWLAAGFSGHGFKFCSVLGKLIAEAVLTGRRDPRLDFLGLQRLAAL